MVSCMTITNNSLTLSQNSQRNHPRSY